MKTLVCFILAILTMPATAKIWIVDSNPGSTAKDFITLNAAYADAAAGDTLYLIGSPNNYLSAQLVISKRLIIIGPGYFLNENPNTQVSVVSANATFVSSCQEAIRFNPGSEGTVMMGLQVNGITIVSANNISLRRNRFNHIAGGCIEETIIVGGSNCLIQQNYIGGPNSRGIKVNSGMANVTVSNNFITNFCAPCGDPNQLAVVATGATTVFSNNVIYAAINVSNAIVENNIFPAGSFFYSASVVRNNIHQANNLPAGDGNQNNVPPSTVFVLTGSSDGIWQLKAGSPAIGTGFGGVDCGMFGGPEPYVLSGIPPIPTIYSLTAPAVGEKNTGLPIQIKIKSNN